MEDWIGCRDWVACDGDWTCSYGKLFPYAVSGLVEPVPLLDDEALLIWMISDDEYDC